VRAVIVEPVGGEEEEKAELVSGGVARCRRLGGGSSCLGFVIVVVAGFVFAAV
jgi:hypothetical protein